MPKVRLDLHDVRVNRDPEKCEVDLKMHDMMGETEAAGDTVQGNLVRDAKNAVDAEICDEEHRQMNHEDPRKERDELGRNIKMERMNLK